MENKEKLYKIYFGDSQDDYINRYLKDDDILDGYLSESKAFDIFFDDMIMCNNIPSLLQHYNIDEIISGYNEENDCYCDEYQFFIVNITFDEELTKKAVEKMGNTFYYIDELNLYFIGVTDLGTSRTIVSTSMKVELVERD